MDSPPEDLDAARSAIAARGLIAEASAHLTGTIAMSLPFETLGQFKDLLKRFFSNEAWTDEHGEALSDLVDAHIEADAWWDHELAPGLRLMHGRRDEGYVLWVTGASGPTRPSVLDRVFEGPVMPEATPHPRKIKFNVGGTPAPGVWYRKGDEVTDERVAELLADGDVTDVMVAGDFVTIGLKHAADWEYRLDGMLRKVADLFASDAAAGAAAEPVRSRDELVAEGLAVGREPDAAELHLLDPDDDTQRERLEAAATHEDPRLRRIAVATLAQASNPVYVVDILRAAYSDSSRIVRRAAIDSTGDVATERLRSLLENALEDEDAWIRWKAVRSLRDLGIAPSRHRIRELAEDEDFQVRMEVASALREVRPPSE